MMMAMILQSSTEPAMAHHDHIKENEITTSERTMPLEEDEKLLLLDDDDDDDLSSTIKLTESASSSSMLMYGDEKLDLEESDDDDARQGAKQVKFAPLTSRYVTISLEEYTQEEMEETFWTPSQLENVNKVHFRTAARLEAGLKELKSVPFRRLEKFTKEGYLHSMEAVNGYIHTVLNEVKRQRKEESEDETKLWDWEKIASLTQEMTKQSAQEAIMIALKDEKEARAAANPRSIMFKKKNCHYLVKQEPSQKNNKQELGKRVSNMSLFFGKVRSAKRRTSSSKNNDREKDRLEAFIRKAEMWDCQ